MIDGSDKPTYRAVHLVETHGEGGHLTTHLTTDCPLFERVVSVDECVACAHCAGVVVLPGQARPSIACTWRVSAAAGARAAGGALGPPPDPSWPSTPAVSNATLHALAARGWDFGDSRVGAAMTRDVICFRLDTPLDDVTRVLIERRISGAPVLDGDNRIVGVISKSDLLTRRSTDVTVSDVLTHLVFFLPETATLAQAAALMAFEGIHRIPIASPACHVVGILSAIDVLRWLARGAGLLTDPGEASADDAAQPGDAASAWAVPLAETP